MVKRWRPDVTYVTGECFAGMIRDSQGEYVEYDDYAAIEAENARLKEALRECVEGFDSTTGFTDEEGDPLSRAMRKAREVLGE